MSLVLGAFNSDSVDGLKAILRAWPVLPVSNTMEKLPGGGSLYYGSRVVSTDWTFNLELTAVGTSEVLNKSVEVSNLLNPLVGGVATFVPNAADGWEWQGVVKSLSDWKRDKTLWFGPGKICRMTSTLVVTTPDPYGRKNGPALRLTTPGSVSVPVIPGGYTYYPYMEFRGTIGGAGSVTIGGTKFNTQLAADQTLVVDHENMDYFIKETPTTPPPVEDARNLCPNPTAIAGGASLGATGGAPWSQTLGVVIPATPNGTTTAAEVTNVSSSAWIAATSGVDGLIGNTTPRTVTMLVRNPNTVGIQVSIRTASQVNVFTTVPAGEARTISREADNNVLLYARRLDATAVAGDKVQWTDITTADDFFTGNTPNTETHQYAWDGPPHNAPSVRYVVDTTLPPPPVVKVRNVADRIETFGRLGGGTQPMDVDLAVSGGTINELVIVPKFRRV